MSGYGPNAWVQRHWDWRAAGNFIFGGAGSGLLLAAALVLPNGIARSLALPLGCALVGLGLFCVWLEIGRPWRALHVYFNPWTSWMTREAFAGLILLAAAAVAFFRPGAGTDLALALCAALYAWCQGRILKASKGIPAWRAPEVVLVVFCTAVAEGAGVALLLGSDLAALPLFAIAVFARAFAWSVYRNALRPSPSLAALETAGRALIELGCAAVLALVLVSAFVPQVAPLAGLIAIATGWRFKFALVTRAAFNQGFALPRLPTRGAR